MTAAGSCPIPAESPEEESTSRMERSISAILKLQETLLLTPEAASMSTMMPNSICPPASRLPEIKDRWRAAVS